MSRSRSSAPSHHPPAIRLRFHFDFISPYAFLAWTRIRAIATLHGCVLEPVPVLFAALLDANGQKGPAEIPAKRRYLFKDIARKAHRLGVTVTPPPAHPFNPLLPLRVSSLPDLDAIEREGIIDALYAAVWTQGRAIDTAEQVASILTEADFDGAELVRGGQGSEAKERLRTATDTAIEQGIFGVPSITTGHPDSGGELFWGTDSLDDLESFLRGEMPSFSDAGWSTLPSTAQRKAVLKA